MEQFHDKLKIKKESKYLLHFSLTERYLEESDYKKAVLLSEDIGKMLWSTIQKI